MTVSNLANGTYWVRLSSEGQQMTLPLVFPLGNLVRHWLMSPHSGVLLCPYLMPICLLVAAYICRQPEWKELLAPGVHI